ncbi:MAG: hypothetical protein FJX71_06885 [Alphaproteobacteria bacterium]|nr:hypothetical protein [Alphaproteobacteria bacterium]
MADPKDNLVLTSPTTLEWCGKIYQCRTGHGGIRSDKVEGDYATPIGIFPLRQVLYRPDRIRPFPCALQMVSLTPIDGWCDDPTDPFYNCLIKIPYPSHHEVLWREDNVYDILLVVGYNDSPSIPPKGSAIFIHLMNEAQTPTEGCIALSRKDIIDILSEISPSTQLIVPEYLDQTLTHFVSKQL